MAEFEEFLKDQLDPDHGLLGKLRNRKALSKGEIDIINAKLTYRERNAKIIECLSDKNKQSDFIAALREADQTHVANYLEAKGSKKYKNKTHTKMRYYMHIFSFYRDRYFPV